MTLSQRIEELVRNIGGKFKALWAALGHPSNLKTAEKGSIVGAVNELKDLMDGIGAGGAAINDSASAADTVYSSAKTAELIAQAKAETKTELLDGAPEALDTLKELGDRLNEDGTAVAALTQAVGQRLRIDEAQTLTSAQKTAVQTTIGLGDTDTDFVAVLNEAAK